MKKEKQVRSYKRRTKSGKTVTVKSHTAKYEASDRVKEISKKEGAGKELEERKKKSVQLEIPFDKEEENKVLDDVKETDKKESTKNPAEKKTTKKVRPVGSGTKEPTPKRKSEAKVAKTTASRPATSELAFTAAEFKEWYRGTGSAADKKVAKALRAQLGRSGYRKLEDEAIDNYSSRGHLSLFKGLSSAPATKTSSQKKEAKVKEAKVVSKPTTKKFDADSFFETPQPTMRKLHPYSRKLTQVIDPDVRAGSFKVGDASFRMERTKHKDGTYTIMVGQNDGTPGFTKHLASSGSLKSKEEASSYAKKVYTHLTGGKDPSGIRNFATKSSTKKSSVGTGTSKTKAAKSESSKGTTKEDKLFAKMSEMQKTWDKKYHRSDKNGGEAFRKKLNKLEDKYNEMTAGEKLGVKSSSKKK